MFNSGNRFSTKTLIFYGIQDLEILFSKTSTKFLKLSFQKILTNFIKITYSIIFKTKMRLIYNSGK